MYRFSTTMLVKDLCALRKKGNVQKPVCCIVRFQWSHIAKLAEKLLLITINANSLEVFMF